MRIAFDITHPADIHQFKNLITALKKGDHKVVVTARNIPPITELLDCLKIDYLTRQDTNGSFLRVIKIIPIVKTLYKIYKPFEPDILIGSSGNLYIPLTAKLLRSISIIFDDTEHTTVQNFLTFPLADHICTPACYQLNLGTKQTRYDGIKELAYLHSDFYDVSSEILLDEFNTAYLNLPEISDKKIILLRLVAWCASHDLTKKSIINWNRVIEKLEKKATVVIVSDNDGNKNTIKSNIALQRDKFHDLICLADIVISEGASTAAEAAVLGKPVIYCNKIKLGYINFLDSEYGLITQVDEEEKLLQQIDNLLLLPNLKNFYQAKRELLLSNQLNVSNWMLEFIENLSVETGSKKIYIIANYDPANPRPGGIESYITAIASGIKNKVFRCHSIGVTETRQGNIKSSIEPFESHQSVYRNKNSTFTTSFQFLFNLFFRIPLLKIDRKGTLHFQRIDHAVPFIFHSNRKLCTIHGNPAEVIKMTRNRAAYFLYRLFERMALPSIQSVSFVDQRTMQMYKKKYPRYQKRFLVIPPPVSPVFQLLARDKKKLMRKKYNISDDERIVLLVSRLEKEKNIFEMIDIFEQLNIHEFSMCTFLVVGSGSLYCDLKASEKSNNKRKIKILGFVEQTKLVEIYNIADTTFLFSHSEGLPIVALESLMCGTPVICSDVGDLSRLIRNGYNGFIVTSKQEAIAQLDFILRHRPDWDDNCVASATPYRQNNFIKKILKFYNFEHFHYAANGSTTENSQ